MCGTFPKALVFLFFFLKSDFELITKGDLSILKKPRQCFRPDHYQCWWESCNGTPQSNLASESTSDQVKCKGFPKKGGKFKIWRQWYVLLFNRVKKGGEIWTSFLKVTCGGWPFWGGFQMTAGSLRSRWIPSLSPRGSSFPSWRWCTSWGRGPPCGWSPARCAGGRWWTSCRPVNKQTPLLNASPTTN